MKKLNKKCLVSIVAFTFFGLSGVAPSYGSGRTVKQKMEDTGYQTKRGAKKLGRKVQDQTCEMVHGKMECAGKKAKHSIQNAVE